MPILDLSPGDQTLTLTGDVTLAEVYAALPPGLYPPFAPVELPGGVGGLVSRGGFGQTFFFGAEVLGVVLRTRSGRVVRAGGRTVKNVQGYDLTRPFVGSFGALGGALELTLRLRPGLSACHVAGPGRLDDLPAHLPRFAWEQEGELHLWHFGHPREVEALTGDLLARPGARVVEGMGDLSPLFPGGLGVGEGGPARDRRFGWVDGGAVPPVPALFERLAASL